MYDLLEHLLGRWRSTYRRVSAVIELFADRPIARAHFSSVIIGRLGAERRSRVLFASKIGFLAFADVSRD